MTPYSSRVRPAALLAAFALAPAPVRAQEWIVDLAAGHAAYDAIASSVATTGLTLGIRHEAPLWLRVSAGVPFDSTGLPWGAVGLGNHLPTRHGRLAFGIDAGGHGFAYRDRLAAASGGGVAAEAMPLLAVRADAIRLELRSGLQHYTSFFSASAIGRTALQTDARASVIGQNLTFTAESRYLRAADGGYPFVGGSFELSTGPLVVVAHAARWFSERVDAPLYGAQAILGLNRRTDVHLRVRQETNDPLFWNMPRRSWSVGFTHRFGRAPLLPPSPVAPLLTESGVTFRLPLSVSTTPPSVAGEFSGWKTVQMAGAGEFWSVTLRLPRGVYRYAFRTADGNWFVPATFPGREADGYGGANAVLIVP